MTAETPGGQIPVIDECQAVLEGIHSAVSQHIENLSLPQAHTEIADLYESSDYPEIVSQWAVDTISHYEANKKSGSKKKGTSARSINRMLTRAPDKDGQPSHIIFNTDALEIAAQVWTHQADSGNKAASAFLEEARLATGVYAKEHWREITHESLSGLFGLTAAEVPGSGIATEALRGYFEAPVTVKDSIDLKYTLAEAVIDLADSPEALHLAIMVGLHETNMLARGGLVHINHVAITDGAVHEDELHSRAVMADIVITTMSEFIGLDLDRITKSNIVALQNSPQFNRQLQLMQAEAALVLGEREQQARIKAVKEQKEPKVLDKIDYVESEIAAMTPARRWAFDHYEASKDSLAVRYATYIGPMMAGRRYGALLEQKTGLSYDITNIFLPEANVAVDVYCLPGTPNDVNAEIYNQVLQKIGVHVAEQHRIQQMLSRLGITRKVASQPLEFEFDGARIPLFVRTLSGFEAARMHPLQKLVEVGFPLPTELAGVGTEDVMEAIELLKEDVAEGSRFAGRRPIRFLLNAAEYRSLGYTHIDLMQDPNSDGLIAYLFHNGEPHEVKLDGNYDINADNKILSMPGFVESLNYVILRQFESWTNDYVTNTSEGTVRGDGTSRVSFGRLVYLREGANFSPSRASAFSDQRPNSYGGDLALASELRKRSPRSRGRSSTYREEKYDKKKPPLVVYGRHL